MTDYDPRYDNLTDDPNYYKRKKREWYLKNKEYVSRESKKWRAANPERAKENILRWKAQNPEKVKIHSQKTKHRQMLKKYQLTSEQYDAMVDAQKGLCAICQRECSSGRRLAVDHDHVTGKARGLLCTSCNIRLGYIETVKAMRFKLRPFLRYLKAHST